MLITLSIVHTAVTRNRLSEYRLTKINWNPVQQDKSVLNKFVLNAEKPLYWKPEIKKFAKNVQKKRVYKKTTFQNPNLSYDTIHIYVPKGEKVKLQDWVKSKNLTLNKAYNMAMQLFMEQLDKEDTESNTLL